MPCLLAALLLPRFMLSWCSEHSLSPGRVRLNAECGHHATSVRFRIRIACVIGIKPQGCFFVFGAVKAEMHQSVAERLAWQHCLMIRVPDYSMTTGSRSVTQMQPPLLRLSSESQSAPLIQSTWQLHLLQLRFIRSSDQHFLDLPG
jgi:hypothetical protein